MSKIEVTTPSHSGGITIRIPADVLAKLTARVYRDRTEDDVTILDPHALAVAVAARLLEIDEADPDGDLTYLDAIIGSLGVDMIAEDLVPWEPGFDMDEDEALLAPILRGILDDEEEDHITGIVEYAFEMGQGHFEREAA